METKTKIVTGIAVFLALALLPLVSATNVLEHQLYCLQEGESLNLAQLCNPAMSTITGPTNICMQILDNGKICPTTLNRCNNLGLSCSGTGGNTTVDSEPPIMTLNSPDQGELYTSRSVLVNFNVNEPSDVYYQDKSDPRRWSQVCKKCTSYSRERGFNEGLNELIFRVIDMSENEAYYNVSFYVDSKSPKIKKALPDKGFASGDFEIEFEEDNPSVLKVEYGNGETGSRTEIVNIANECVKGAKSYVCSTQINLADYDGESIQYYVSLEDIAGNVAQSKIQIVQVDYSDPVITSFERVVEGKKVTFTLDIDEPFFSEVTYMDGTEANPKEKRLCSSLVNGVCEKTVSFSKDGEHEITLFVRDEAGNIVMQETSFFTDSKKPKIRSVIPDGDFASGTFEIEFEENNAESLSLNYGNSESGFRDRAFDLGNCQMIKAGRYFCSEEVSLADYDGEDIDYSFTLTDRVGQIAEDGEEGLRVDLSVPVINSINYTLAGKRADLMISITEDNFEEVVYINHDASRPRETRLCSSLKNGICQKKINLNLGENELQITVVDEAGNAVSQNIFITV